MKREDMICIKKLSNQKRNKEECPDASRLVAGRAAEIVGPWAKPAGGRASFPN